MTSTEESKSTASDNGLHIYQFRTICYSLFTPCDHGPVLQPKEVETEPAEGVEIEPSQRHTSLFCASIVFLNLCCTMGCISRGELHEIRQGSGGLFWNFFFQL